MNNNMVLCEIDDLSDFLLAVASGANVNGTYNGKPILSYIWTEFVNCTFCHPEMENYFDKLQILVNAGADSKNALKNSYGYDLLSALKEVNLLLKGIELIVNSSSFKDEILVNEELNVELKKLKETVQNVNIKSI